MKKTLTRALLISSMLIATANAGKNYIPATSEPIPVPTVIPYLPLGLFLGGGLTYTHSECQCDGSTTCADGSSCSTPHTSSVYGVNLKAGYMLNEYIGVEAKYMYTPYKGSDIKHYGIYLKPTYPVTDHIDIYALLGYGKTECQLSNQSHTGFGWGAGAEYTLNKKINGQKDGFGVYVEYLRPLKKTGNRDITVDMVNAGVTYNF